MMRPKVAARLGAFGSILLAAAMVSPAHAERWQLLTEVPGVRQYSLDLDSVHWAGRVVTYRVQIADMRREVPRRFVVSSMINCETRVRKQLSSEEILPDGSRRKLEILPDWRPIQASSGIEQACHYFCDEHLPNEPHPLRTNVQP